MQIVYITTETCNLKNNIFGNKLKTKWISYYTTNIIQTKITAGTIQQRNSSSGI
jgi:hypothetical protein